MKTKQLLCRLTVSLTLASTPVLAVNRSVHDIQTKWAECQYDTTDADEREQCLQFTIEKTKAYLVGNPENPDLMIWLAINKASLAGTVGGLGGLSLVKEAKAILEDAIEISPTALSGSAYTSLGSLYYKVPGWPVGFGDDKKAEEMLKKALEINPNGIDSNYFYGDFLAEDGQDEEAKIYLNRAMQASPRPNRALADSGRRQEIEAALGRLN
ncbi:tetratricopeptide repeat protein [Vibrio sp. RC27]